MLVSCCAERVEDDRVYMQLFGAVRIQGNMLQRVLMCAFKPAPFVCLSALHTLLDAAE